MTTEEAIAFWEFMADLFKRNGDEVGRELCIRRRHVYEVKRNIERGQSCIWREQVPLYGIV
jgi:hypothetical protein